MSKFLKFLVALILIVFIGAGAALIVPPFFGVEADVVREDTDSDLAVGTTIYSKTMKLDTLTQGEKVLTQDNNSAIIHEVRSFDAETGIAETAAGLSLQFSSAYRKVYFTLPLIGYLSIATQSQTGLIILLGVLILVVILFIISEVLRHANRRDEEDEDEDDDDEFYSGLVEKKRRSEKGGKASSAYRNDRDEEPEIIRQSGAYLSDEDETAVFGDIFDDEDFRETSRERAAKKAAAARRSEAAQRPARNDANEPAPRPMRSDAKEAASRPTYSGLDDSAALPNVQAALEAALENQQLGRTETIPHPAEVEQVSKPINLPPEELELAIPYYTADELIQKAYADGKDPTVIEDETTGITLVDFSDCL